jgi:hypothetical protein
MTEANPKANLQPLPPASIAPDPSNAVEVRLWTRFRTFLAAAQQKPTDGVLADQEATGRTLALLFNTAQRHPGPWLDAPVMTPPEMALALLEHIEAIDATDARQRRRTGRDLLTEEERSFVLSMAGRLNAPAHPVSCRDLVQLFALSCRAKASPHATAGDPSFIRKSFAPQTYCPILSA